MFGLAALVGGCQSGVQVGTFKGTFDVFFTGQAIDSVTAKPLEQLNVEVGFCETPLLSRTVVPYGSEYSLSFGAPTINGITYWRDKGLFDYGEVSVLGPGNEYVIFYVTSWGYEPCRIQVPKDRIVVGQVNVLDIVLKPLGQGDGTK